MKLFIFALLLLTANLSAGLAPRKIHNEQKHAYAHKIEIKDVDTQSHHIAYYAQGRVVTVLSGPAHGLQWIENEAGEVTAYADKLYWHGHSFTAKYAGAKIHSYTTHSGKHGQTITYYKH
jgi:hypothetical protein